MRASIDLLVDKMERQVPAMGEAPRAAPPRQRPDAEPSVPLSLGDENGR